MLKVNCDVAEESNYTILSGSSKSEQLMLNGRWNGYEKSKSKEQ